MKNITLRTSNRTDFTTIPNIFIDEYMPKANGEFVKIYLYLLRCVNEPSAELSIAAIADKFEHTEKDIVRALKYFAGQGLISIEYDANDELSAITFLPIEGSNEDIAGGESITADKFTLYTKGVLRSTAATSENIPAADIPAAPESSPFTPEPVSGFTAPEKINYSAAQLKEMTSDAEFGELLYIVQQYLGKTLTPSETNSIIYFYDVLKFPVDLIEYLIEYCVTREHKSMRYIEKVAISWAEEGIDTVIKAKDSTQLYSKKIFDVMKAFGLSGRNPAEAEKKLINKWYDTYLFDNDIIIEACSRTIQAIHKPSFEYADSILSHWKANNVKQLSDIAALDSSYAPKKKNTPPAKQASGNSFNNYPQRSYNFDELEKQLISNNQ